MYQCQVGRVDLTSKRDSWGIYLSVIVLTADDRAKDDEKMRYYSSGSERCCSTAFFDGVPSLSS